ncbi:hypothetical protein [Nonomuraea longicatena]|uniref:hypothetical protein n=1 Tax=Nonomuraea longicatena TaxID=83682 RepID=UPI0031E0FAD5
MGTVSVAATGDVSLDFTRLIDPDDDFGKWVRTGDVLRFRVKVVGTGRARLAVAADPEAALTSVSCAPGSRPARPGTRPGTVPAADAEPLGEAVPTNELLLYRNVPSDSKVKQVAANLARTAALGGGAARPVTRSELLTGRHSARGAEVCRLGRGQGEREVDVRVTVPGGAASVVVAAVARIQGDGGPVMAMRTTTAYVDTAQVRGRPMASGVRTSGDLPGAARGPVRTDPQAADGEDAIHGVVADPGEGGQDDTSAQQSSGRGESGESGGENAGRGGSGQESAGKSGSGQESAGKSGSGREGAERDGRVGAERDDNARRDGDRGGAGQGRDGRDVRGEGAGARAGGGRSPDGAGVGRRFDGARPRAGAVAPSRELSSHGLSPQGLSSQGLSSQGQRSQGLSSQGSSSQGLSSQDLLSQGLLSRGLLSREVASPGLPSLGGGGSVASGGVPLGAPASGGPVPGGASRNPVLSGGVPAGTSTGMRESGVLAVGGSANGDSESNALTSPDGVILPAVELAAESAEAGRPLPLAATVAGRRLDNSPRPNPLDGPKSLPIVAGGVAILLLALWTVARRQHRRIQRRS